MSILKVNEFQAKLDHLDSAKKKAIENIIMKPFLLKINLIFAQFQITRHTPNAIKFSQQMNVRTEVERNCKRQHSDIDCALLKWFTQ